LLNQIELEEHKGWGKFLFQTWEEKKLNDFSLEVAFAFHEYQINEPFLKSYVNYIYTHEGGTHVKGLLKGLNKALTVFCEKHKHDEVFEFSDESLRKYLVASIHVQVKQPLFHAPTKNRLVSPEIISPIADFVAELFLQKLENDIQTAESLIRRFKVWG
jgi:DNA gyrase subunit B